MLNFSNWQFSKNFKVFQVYQPFYQIGEIKKITEKITKWKRRIKTLIKKRIELMKEDQNRVEKNKKIKKCLK
jgi:hypothetical protein